MVKNRTLFEEVIQLHQNNSLISFWKLCSSFEITNFEELDAYCLKHHLTYVEDPVKYFTFEVDHEKVLADLKKQTFTSTAYFDDKFRNFGITKTNAVLYGCDSSDVIDVELTIHEDQNVKEREHEYWGWYDYRDSKLHFIFDAYFLMSMCFAQGAEKAKEQNRGLPVKLNVKKI